MKEFIRDCSDLNAVVNDEVFSGMTPLCWACTGNCGRVEFVALLLDARADVGRPTARGCSPLQFACWAGAEDVCELLIARGASPHSLDVDRSGPLHCAAWNGHLGCIMQLVRARACVDQLNVFGYTPLANAIKRDRMSCAEFLLDAGAKLPLLKIPPWMKRIIAKRTKVRSALLVLSGVLRKRFTVVNCGMDHIQGRLPMDIVRMLERLVWDTRFDERWGEVSLSARERGCLLQ